jgi:hypothetical protein
MALYRTAANAYAVRIYNSRNTSATGGGAANVVAHGSAFAGQEWRRVFVNLDDHATAIYVAPSAGGPQSVPLTAATETDSGGSLGRVKVKALGSVTETDTAGAVTRVHRRALTASTETDTAGALAKAKSKAVTAATETDTGTIARRKTRALTAATETDTPTGVAPRKTRSVGAATSTETGVAVSRVKRKAVTGAAETDTAGSVSLSRIVAVGSASETDTAGTLARRKTRTAGNATETDTAGSISDRKTLGTAAETDAAVAVGRRKTRALGSVTETDTAGALTRVRSRALGAGAETDAGGTLGRKKTLALTAATETDTAGSLPAPGGATFLFQEDYEGTAGAAMSGSNTGWDLFNGAGTRTLESTPTPIYGSTLGEYNGGQALTKDTTSLPGTTNGGTVRRVLYARGYYKLANTTSLTLSRILVFEESVANGGADVGVLRINATGTFRLLDGTTTVGSASTKTLDTNYTRIELKIDQDANTIEARFWWGADLQSESTGATNYESISGTLATNTDMEVFGTGFYASQTTNNSLYVEEFAVGYGDWLGPVPTAQVVNLGGASETDAASSVGRRKVKALTAATETDTANGITRRKTRAVTAATETDAATGVGRISRTSLGTSTSSEAAAALARKKALALGVATEIDTANGIAVGSGPTIVVLGTALETDIAVAIASTQATPLWTFIPPSSGTANRHRRTNSPKGRLFPRVSGQPIHYCVLIFDLDATPRIVKTRRPNTAQMESADRVYLGPREYTVGSTEYAVLATEFPDDLVPVP